MNMLETVMAFIKSLPAWLGAVAEILVVAIIFMTAITLLGGIWIGFCIARKRMNQIAEIEFFPPKITFKEREK